MKKNKKIIIISAIILGVVILLSIIFFIKKSGNSQKIEMIGEVSAGDTKEQVYTATKSPSLKDDDRIFGSKDAAIKIFVYEDNSNIYSANLADTLDKIYADKPNEVAVIVRSFFPANSLAGKEAALAVECAGDQSKWIAMRALLFSKTKNENLNSGEFNKYAKQISLDENAFLACLTNQTKSAKIEELSSAAGDYDVLGAPTMFIGDEMILGARPYEDYIDSGGDNIDGLKTIIDRKLK